MARKDKSSRRRVHAPGHTRLVVPAGFDRAACGELVSLAQVSENGVSCRACVEVAARTVESAAELAGHSRGAARRALGRAQRRAQGRAGRRGGGL